MDLGVKAKSLHQKSVYSQVNRPDKCTSNLLKTSDKKIINDSIDKSQEIRTYNAFDDATNKYNSAHTEYYNDLRSSYVDENSHFKGYGLEEMVSKYDSFYKEIDESDLSDQDKDIKKFALKDAFTSQAKSFSHYINMSICYESSKFQSANVQTKGNSYINSKEKWDHVDAMYKQQVANSTKFAKLTSMLFSYYAKDDKSKNIFEFLQENGSDTKSIDKFGESLHTANKSSSFYSFDDVSNEEMYSKDKLKETLDFRSGYNEMLDKYDLEKTVIDLSV